DQEIGLRERKKLQTRQLIAETARRLFLECGFDAVPVAAVAREANVSEATVFNYFPTKEDLVYQGMEAFETELLAAVRNRPAGEPIIAAFGRFVLQPRGLLAADDEAAARQLADASKMIASSQALLAREQQIFAHYTAPLAVWIADDPSAGAGARRPWAAAPALMGTHRPPIISAPPHLPQGAVDPARLADEVKARGQQALDLLAADLGSYG